MAISNSESSPDTPDLLNQVRESVRPPSFGDGRAKSAPELELLNFIDSVAMLVGPGSTRTLTEIWLDELACMDCIPEPNSSDWRMVSLAASARLASKLMSLQFRVL
jgi:hypothetical protein